ncbi:transporter, partial [Streptomyces sp. NPDC059810]
PRSVFRGVTWAPRARGGAGGVLPHTPAPAVVGWLPPAAAIAAVDSASQGDYAVAAVRLLLTAVALAALLYWWQRSLVRLMVEPDGSTIGAASDTGGRDKADGTGLLARILPDGRTGAVMERSLRYLWRDPKTKAGAVTSLALGLIVPLVNALQGTGSIYWACFASGMLGMLMYNQFGQDTSAFWMVAQTISTTADAYAELKARALALLMVTLPYAVFVTVLTVAVLGDWERLPDAVGLALGLLGAMLATGSVASAVFPYSIPQDSGYKNVAPGQGALAWISILGGMLTAPVLCAPLIGATIYLHVSDQESLLWLLFPAGTLYGALLVWVGLKVAAPRTARRLPEILAAVSKG